MGIAAVDYPVLCKLDLITKRLSNDKNLLELLIHRVGEHADVGSGIGTDLTDVNFVIPACKLCASDKQFSEHLLLGYTGPFAVSLLGREHIVVRP